MSTAAPVRSGHHRPRTRHHLGAPPGRCCARWPRCVVPASRSTASPMWSAEAVVDALEAVDLQHQHRGFGRWSAGPGTQVLEEPLAVRQAGQFVELQQLLDTLFGGASIAQVVHADMGERLPVAGHQADGDVDRDLMRPSWWRTLVSKRKEPCSHISRQRCGHCASLVWVSMSGTRSRSNCSRVPGRAAGRRRRWHRERRRRARPGTTRRWPVRRHGGSGAIGAAPARGRSRRAPKGSTRRHASIGPVERQQRKVHRQRGSPLLVATRTSKRDRFSA